jgi:hypothetical protein
MRVLFILVLAIVPAIAQIPLVQLLDASRPGSDFRVGDRFEIVITARMLLLPSKRDGSRAGVADQCGGDRHCA